MKAHLFKVAVFSICLAIAGTGAVPSAGGEPCDGTYGSGPNRFVLATGSPGELGLVKALADVFTARTNTTLCWKKAGSGESLKMLKEKTADVIMGHSPDAEKKRWRKAGRQTTRLSARMSSSSSGLQRTRRVSRALRQPSRPIGKLRKPGQSFFHGGTIPARTRKSSRFGPRRESPHPETGTS